MSQMESQRWKMLCSGKSSIYHIGKIILKDFKMTQKTQGFSWRETYGGFLLLVPSFTTKTTSNHNAKCLTSLYLLDFEPSLTSLSPQKNLPSLTSLSPQKNLPYINWLTSPSPNLVVSHFSYQNSANYHT